MGSNGPLQSEVVFILVPVVSVGGPYFAPGKELVRDPPHGRPARAVDQQDQAAERDRTAAPSVGLRPTHRE